MLRLERGWALRSWRSLLLGLTLSMLAGPGIAVGAELECVPGSGSWSDDGSQLSGALCKNAAGCLQLVRFNFTTSEAQIAHFPEHQLGCELEWLGADGGIGFVQDGERLLGVDLETFSVVSNIEFPQATQLQAPPEEGLLLRSGARLVFWRGAAKGVTIAREITVGELVDIEWQADRLVILEQGKLRWWLRTEDGGYGPEQVNTFSEKLQPRGYALDRDGLIIAPLGGRQVRWVRFEPDSSTRIGLNASEVTRAVGASPGEAVVITSDGHVTKTLARWGALLRDRYVVRYWPLSTEDTGTADDPRPLAMAAGKLLALDGGVEAKRAAIINTSELTWRRRLLIEYSSPGRFLWMDQQHLVTFHPKGDRALIAWRLSGGKRDFVIRRSALEEVGLSSLSRARHLADHRYLIEGGARYALVDLETGAVQGMDLSQSCTSSQIIDAGADPLIIACVDNDRVEHWELLSLGAPTKTLTAAGELRDALDSTVRWFGQCIPNQPCVSPAATLTRPAGDDAAWADLKLADVASRSTLLSALVLGLTLLVVILVTAWRTDFGRRGQLGELQAARYGGSVVDKKGRRFLTDRDCDGYVHRTITQLPWRLGLSLVGGTLLASAISYNELLLEPVGQAALFWSSLFLPVASLIWLVLSWGVWNRRHLLRFGVAIEGQWFDSGKPQQSLCYTLNDGRTYRLKRGQWSSPDLVPVVLFDPKRPGFASQYTGNGNFNVEARRDAGELEGTAITRDFVQHSLLVVVFIGLALGAFFSFQGAFPEPITAWQLKSLEAQHGEDGMLLPCLELCASVATDNAQLCEEQCHNRQLHNILSAAGVELAADPALMPAEFRAQQLSTLKALQERAQDASLSCDALAAELEDFELWTPELQEAFLDIYAEEERQTQALIEVEAELAAIGNEWLSPLCDKNESCPTERASCPATPQCSGPTQQLRPKLCSLGMALVGQIP